MSVAWRTVAGTALTPSDFVVRSGMAVIPTGATRVTITIRVVPDARPEPDEHFTVRLSAPTGATIVHARGIGTILTDD